MKKRLMNVIAIIFFIALTWYVIFTSFDIKQLMDLIKTANKIYIFFAMSALCFSWIFDTASLRELINNFNHNKNFFTSFKITVVGQYYSLITPFASGGQPAQVYYMSKDNIPMGRSTAILVDKFIIYQTIVMIYSSALLVFKFDYFLNMPNKTKLILLYGLIINTIGLVVIGLIVFNPKVIENIFVKIITLLSKMRLIRKKDEKIITVRKYIEEYNEDIMFILKNGKLLFKITLLTIVQLTFFFSITFFLFKALNLEGISFISIIALQSVLYMIVSFIPIPGTVGVSELAFFFMFGNMFSSNTISLVMILWRTITYYLNLLACGSFTLLFYLYDRRKRILNSNAQ